MFKKIIILFKLARKIALSDALKIISKIQKPPLIISLFFSFFSLSFKKKINFKIYLMKKSFVHPYKIWGQLL